MIAVNKRGVIRVTFLVVGADDVEGGLSRGPVELAHGRSFGEAGDVGVLARRSESRSLLAERTSVKSFVRRVVDASSSSWGRAPSVLGEAVAPAT